MRVEVAERLDELARALAARLATPMADPMAPELIVVPTVGMQRWLSLELSRHLGASGPNRTDGVCANIDMIFPGNLAGRVMHPGLDRDPWALEHVVWVLLEILTAQGEPDGGDQRSDIPLPSAMLRLSPGATAWSRARRLADLFDRYLTHRPEMIRAWAAGQDVNGAGARIEDRARWQPHLWRQVRNRIGTPSPPEAAPRRIAALRSGQCPQDVPERVLLFGLSTIPGGSPYIEFLEALGTQREVCVYLHQPSLGLLTSLEGSEDPEHHTTILRADDQSADLVRHPLLRSWGRTARETLLLLGEHHRTTSRRYSTEDAEPTTLLGRFQADLRANRAPGGTFKIGFDGGGRLCDNSITIHSCHGDTRQVEVLRDQILHLLADDPTLAEDDIVVLCPALERFAPLIEAVLGPTAPDHHADAGTHEGVEDSLPALRYRLSDRSLGSTYPLLAATGTLLELLSSRFSDAAVIDFANLAPVRRRFNLDDDAIERLSGWIGTANTRWGLDGPHRSRWGLPSGYDAGTWGKTLDRLLAGVTTSEDPTASAFGGLVPIGVEGDGITVVGSLAEFLTRLARIATVAQTPHTASEWVGLLDHACGALFDVDPNREWEFMRLRGIFERIVDESLTPARGNAGHLDGLREGTPSEVLLTLADVRHLVGDHLGGSAGRPAFFRGGTTISSPASLRGIPHRVVCLLGMDESAVASATPDGDDLTAAEPHVGDRDQRAEVRQVLLEALLTARDHLVVTHNGRDVVTNQRVPPAVLMTELIETLAATVNPQDRDAFLEQLTAVHPRQRFDEGNFLTGAVTPGPWSFDPVAMRAAEARRRIPRTERFITKRLGPVEPPSGEEPDTVTLAELQEFLVAPPKFFLRRVLQLSLPDAPSKDAERSAVPAVTARGIPPLAPGRDLLVSLNTLESWGVKDRLLHHLLSLGAMADFETRERAADTLPPGVLGDDLLTDAAKVVEPMIEALWKLRDPDVRPEPVPIDIILAGGSRIIGTVRNDQGHDDSQPRPGPMEITVSKQKPEHLLSSWLDLLALTATDPGHRWRALHLSHGTSSSKSGPGCTVVSCEFTEHDAAANASIAGAILDELISLYRAGHQEPIPFFPATSRAIYDGKRASGKWHSTHNNGGGDGTDPWVRTAFDDADFEEITRMALVPHDPKGSATDRAGLYAEIIWGAYERSAPAQKVKLK